MGEFRQRTEWLFPLLLLAILSGKVDAAAVDVPALCARREAEILGMVKGDQISQAILASAEYERELRGCCAASTIAQGKFASADLLLDFNIPFAKEWKPASLNSIPNLEAIRNAGFEMIVMLDGPTEAEHLLLAMMDVESFGRRMGLKDLSNMPKAITLSRQMSGNFGRTTSERVEKAGSLEVIRTTLAGARTVQVATIERDGRAYFLISIAAPDAQEAENARRMDQWVAALKFRDPDPKTVAGIAAIRAKVPANPDAKDQLAAVRELAALGEYREAMISAVDLRASLVALLPKPRVDAKGITFASYGVTITNPDAERWKTNDTLVGNMHFLILQDRASIKEAFAGVMVMDPILMFGPDALKLIGPNDPENEENRAMLSSMGRGSLLNIGKKIEGERFSKFHGRLAYEGSVDANAADMRMKCILVRGSRALYMIMLAGAPENLPEYEKMIDANLQIRDAGNGASTKPGAAKSPGI